MSQNGSEQSPDYSNFNDEKFESTLKEDPERTNNDFDNKIEEIVQRERNKYVLFCTKFFIRWTIQAIATFLLINVLILTIIFTVSLFCYSYNLTFKDEYDLVSDFRVFIKFFLNSNLNYGLIFTSVATIMAAFFAIKKTKKK